MGLGLFLQYGARKLLLTTDAFLVLIISSVFITRMNLKSARSTYDGVDIVFVQVQVRCSLVYMDFEGRSDGRSIKNILSHVAPLKLVWISLVLFFFN